MDTELTAILIDDELDSLESLQTEIEAYCPGVRIVGAYQKPMEGVKAVKEHSPNVVFLDIEMPEMNGFEVLKQFDQIDFDVIFVTAYDQFAVKAFEFNAQDYLLKPVLKSKLEQAVAKVKSSQSKRLDQTSLNAIMNHITAQSSSVAIKNIALPTSEGFEFVQMDEITHVMSESNYCWVHLKNGKKHFLAKTLKQMELLIHGPQFFRSHQSYLVNLNFAAKYVRGQGGYLVLHDQTQIPVSRANKEHLIQKLKS